MQLAQVNPRTLRKHILSVKMITAILHTSFLLMLIQIMRKEFLCIDIMKEKDLQKHCVQEEVLENTLCLILLSTSHLLRALKRSNLLCLFLQLIVSGRCCYLLTPDSVILSGKFIWCFSVDKGECWIYYYHYYDFWNEISDYFLLFFMFRIITNLLSLLIWLLDSCYWVSADE